MRWASLHTPCRSQQAASQLCDAWSPVVYIGIQEYWPAVIKFARQHTTVSAVDEAKDKDEEGVEAAVHASQAGVKPPAAAGPFVTDSSQPSSTPFGQAVKKEL